MSSIQFESQVLQIGRITLLRFPPDVSQKLPSRGMTMVKGTINSAPILMPLEPDGIGGHWMDLDSGILKAARAQAGDIVELAIEPTKDWPEPEVPQDLKHALAVDLKASALWNQCTTAARWDWIRWINSTGNSDTREKRIAVALSKMNAGMRRPCCFNRSICTVQEVSKNGVLREA